MPMLLVLLLAAAAAAESWAPPTSAFFDPKARASAPRVREPASEAPVLLVARQGRENHPLEGAEKAAAEFQKQGWTVLRWDADTGGTPFVGMEIALAGSNGAASRAGKALVRAALLAASERPLTLRFLMDGLHGVDRTMDSMEDPAALYARHLVPGWVPPESEQRLWAGRSLEIHVQRHGETQHLLAYGSGKAKVVVRVDLTETRKLARRAPASAPVPVQAKVPAKPAPKAAPAELPPAVSGGPLQSHLEPGLWWGRGDDAGVGQRVSVSGGAGGVDFARIDMRLLGDGRTPEGGLPEGALGVFKAEYDRGPNQHRALVDFGLQGRTHGFSGRYLQTGMGGYTHNLFRGAYDNRLSFGGLTNNATAKLGYLNSSFRYGNSGSSDDEPGQLLFGLSDALSYGLDFDWLAVTAEAGAGAVWSRIEGRNQLDHTVKHGGVEAVIPIRQDLRLMTQYKHRILDHNPEKYFFITKRTDSQALGGIAFDRQRFSAGVMAGVHKVEGEEAEDLMNKGAAWLRLWDTTVTALASKGRWLEQYTLGLSQKVSKDLSVEAYAKRDQAGPVRNDRAGVLVSWGWGGPSTPDERRYRSKGHDVYATRHVARKDQTFEEFSAEMDSARKTNEYRGAVVEYCTGPSDKWVRAPEETFRSDCGDCDDQSFMEARALNRSAAFRAKGGKAHNLVYWAGNGGHGVTLIEQGGRTFVSEYGRIREVKVAADAPVGVKGKAALQQFGTSLALPPQQGKPLMFAVFGSEGDGPDGYFNEANRESEWAYTSEFQLDTRDDSLETGINVRIGADGF